MSVNRSTARRDFVTLFVCSFTIFMVIMDGTILNVALPSLQKGLHSSVTSLQWTVDSYLLVRGTSLFLCGSISDRFGRRRALVVGLVIFTGSSAACGLAPDIPMLVAFRCAQGFGSALMTPSSLGIITNTFLDRRRRARAISIWSAIGAIASTTGPVIGGSLVQFSSWRAVFLVNVPIGIVVLFGTRLLKESKAASARSFDVPGQIVIMIALGVFTYALIEGPSLGWQSSEIIGLFVVAVVAITAFIKIERRVDVPLLEPSLFRERPLIGATTTAVIAFLATGAFTFFNTLYLQEVRGYSPLHAGLLAVPTAILTLCFAPLSGRLTGRRGARLPAVVGCISTGISMVILAVIISRSVPIWELLFAYVMLGVGTGLVNTPLTNAAVSSLPPARAGVAAAITSSARQVGSTMGVALIGSIVFSVVAGTHSGLSAAGLNSSKKVALSFIEGLRFGYATTATLTLGCAVLASWAFKATRSSNVEGETEEVETAVAHRP